MSSRDSSKPTSPPGWRSRVASQIDSRTILDQGGAEKLLGAGDMLYLSGDMGKPVRLQSAFISETEVKKVVDYIAKHNEAELPVDIGIPVPSSSGDSVATGGFSGDDEEIDDDMYEAARAAVLEAGKASTSYLQRKLRVGYARAARSSTSSRSAASSAPATARSRAKSSDKRPRLPRLLAKRYEKADLYPGTSGCSGIRIF